jgi:hypothetical protein
MKLYHMRSLVADDTQSVKISKGETQSWIPQLAHVCSDLPYNRFGPAVGSLISE